MLKIYKRIFLITLIAGVIISVPLLFLPDKSYAFGLLAGIAVELIDLYLLIIFGNKMSVRTTNQGGFIANRSFRLLIIIAPFVIAFIFPHIFHYLTLLLGIIMVKLALFIVTVKFKG